MFLFEFFWLDILESLGCFVCGVLLEVWVLVLVVGIFWDFFGFMGNMLFFGLNMDGKVLKIVFFGGNVWLSILVIFSMIGWLKYGFLGVNILCRGFIKDDNWLCFLLLLVLNRE